MSTPKIKRLYYSIREVSERTQVPPDVLRVWEKKFSKLCPLKRKTGRRLYRQHDMDIVLRIKKFKDEGYTDEHIQSLMGSPGRGYGRRTREREEKIPKIQKDVFFDDLYEDLKEILDILKM